MTAVRSTAEPYRDLVEQSLEEAAFLWKRAGEFTHHQCRRQTPQNGNDAEQQQRARVPRLADDVFQAVGSAGNHEVGGCDQRQQAQALWTSRRFPPVLSGNGVEESRDGL